MLLAPLVFHGSQWAKRHTVPAKPSPYQPVRLADTRGGEHPPRPFSLPPIRPEILPTADRTQIGRIDPLRRDAAGYQLRPILIRQVDLGASGQAELRCDLRPHLETAGSDTGPNGGMEILRP